MGKEKIILLGDSSVGKTALCRKWVHLSYAIEEQSPTYGAGYLENQVYVHESMHKVQVWDTAGQEKYRSMAPIYSRGASGIMLVFDLTCKETFESLPEWINSVGDLTNVHIICVGNKADLTERAVEKDEVMQFCENNGFSYMETSAETGYNVDNAFLKLLSESISDDEPPSVLSEDKEKKNEKDKKEGCC